MSPRIEIVIARSAVATVDTGTLALRYGDASSVQTLPVTAVLNSDGGAWWLQLR